METKNRPRLFGDHKSDEFLSKCYDMFQKREHCDITLIVRKQEIEAHQAVLNISSGYFRTLLCSDSIETKTRRVEFQDWNPKDFLSIIKYCYTGNLQITDENVQNILTMSHYLLIEPVTKFCFEYLYEGLHTRNCVWVYRMAKMYGAGDLMGAAKVFIQRKFEEILWHQDFFLLYKDEVADFISADELSVQCEEAVLAAVGWWLLFDLENRKDHTFELLSLVRLPWISKNHLLRNVLENPLFNADMRCIKLALNAMKLQEFPSETHRLKASESKARFSTMGSLYASCRNKGYVYDPIERVWMGCKAVARTRRGSSITGGSDVAYECGGPDGQAICDLLWIEQNMRIEKPDMTIGRGSCETIFLDGRLYALGGFSENDIFTSPGLLDCAVLGQNWNSISPMHQPRGLFGSASIGKKLYAVGGLHEGVVLAHSECYDVQSNEWKKIACLNQARSGFSLVAANGYLYAIGGFTNSIQSPLNSVERYDTSSDSWSLLEPHPGPSRFYGGIAFWNGKIFYMGGSQSHDRATNRVDSYDPETKKWSQEKCLPEPWARVDGLVLKKSKPDTTIYDVVPYGPSPQNE